MTDPRLTAALALARERTHPLYANVAFHLARDAGDLAAMAEAAVLGAADYRPEPCVYMRSEDDMLDQIIAGEPVQEAMELT
jgi:hypothetical protein